MLVFYTILECTIYLYYIPYYNTNRTGSLLFVTASGVEMRNPTVPSIKKNTSFEAYSVYIYIYIDIDITSTI